MTNERTPDEYATIEQLLAAVMRDRWAGGVFLRGELPRFPSRDTLPTASADYRGRAALVMGGAGVADTIYACLKDAAGAYAWKVVATG